MEEGRKITKKIEFNLESQDLSEEEKMSQSFDILKQEGGLDGEKRIYKVNPELFRRLRFLITVDADNLTPMSDALQKALASELYDRLIANPHADPRVITQELIEVYHKGDSARFMAEEKPVAQAQSQAQAPARTNLVNQINQTGALRGLVEGQVG